MTDRLARVLYLATLFALPWGALVPFPWLHENARWGDALFALAALAWGAGLLAARRLPRFRAVHAGLALYLGWAVVSLLVASPRPAPGPAPAPPVPAPKPVPEAPKPEVSLAPKVKEKKSLKEATKDTHKMIERAIDRGLDFLFSVELTTAAWPGHRYIKPERTTYKTYGNLVPGDPGYKPSGNWWKFGFPVFYNTDLLQVAEALVGLGCADDPRVQPLLAYIAAKRDGEGRWALEYDYADKTWGRYGEKHQPNKWVTLRALRVVNA